MNQEEMEKLIVFNSKQTALFLLTKEAELLAFLETEAKKDRIDYLEAQIAKVPDLEIELSSLKK